MMNWSLACTGETGGQNTDGSTGEDERKEGVDDNNLVQVREMVAVDPDESPPDVIQENDELGMLAATTHVKAARAQRKLFNLKVAKCRNDISNAINPKKVRTLVVDYGQIYGIALVW